MATPQYIHGIDDHPPLRHALLYGLQWAVIIFPALIVVSHLSGRALQLGGGGEIRYFQLVLLTSGLMTMLQCLAGHRYPLLDGPSTALLLTFVTLAPHGIQSIQGGTIVGGGLLVALVLWGKLDKVIEVATPNVVGVILMLIAFTLLPYLIRSMTGVSIEQPAGEGVILMISLFLVLLSAALSHWLSGFVRTVSLLLGIVLGTALFGLMGRIEWPKLVAAGWFSPPALWTPLSPRLDWTAIAAFAIAYIAVIVNSLGSLHGVAKITDPGRLSESISRGVLLNGVGGIGCGLLGLVGLVSYSMSPGVILANRVASRFAVAWCGAILVVAAFVPKLAAALALVPPPVVGAALCSAMGAQVGAGLAVVSSGTPSIRDYFVVGLPLLIGTLVSFLPEPFMAGVAPSLRIFLGNGLIVGIFLVLVLEHLVMKKREG
ncbi:MAG: purine/pyrimidine permease [Syntrophobacteraceae bacterium]|jgi:uracil permease|nr:purine/pyrimidine permease [Syntrophobacteraceae bacterium]